MSTNDWSKTEETGIWEKNGRFRVRTTAKGPDGTVCERQKTLERAKTLADAIAVRDELKREITSPETAANSPARNTFAGLAKRVLEEKTETGEWRESTADHNRKILAAKILPVVGTQPLDGFDRETIREWIRWAENQRKGDGSPYAKGTLRRWWKVLKAVAKQAYLDGYADSRFLEWLRNCRGPQSPVENVREQRTLSVDELHTFLDVAEQVTPQRYPEFVALALTGMRVSELYGMEWRDVDYDENAIHLRRRFYDGDLGDLKSGRTRRVPMIDRVETALRDQRQRLIREQNPGLKVGIVFPSNVGTRRHSSSLTKARRKVTRIAGIEQKVTPQVLRRTFNTVLATPDVDRLVLKSITGHVDEEMVEHYAGIRLETKHEAVRRKLAKGGEHSESG